MREPRGHAEMYGAFLIPGTELTRSGEADIGVLFCHNGESGALFGYTDTSTEVHRGLFDDVRTCNYSLGQVPGRFAGH